MGWKGEKVEHEVKSCSMPKDSKPFESCRSVPPDIKIGEKKFSMQRVS